MIIIYIFLTVILILLGILTSLILYARHRDRKQHYIRPTPVLKGKSAKKFYDEINDEEITEEQKEFLEECKDIYEKNRGD